MTANVDRPVPVAYVQANQQSWVQLGFHTCVKTAIVAAFFYYLFRHEIAGIAGKWLTDSSWSHGLLIPLFCLYFINQAKEKILSIRPKSNYLGLVFLICSILFYFYNTVSPSGYAYFRAVSVIAALGSVVLLIGGWNLLRYTWLPVGYLIFAVPIPDRYYVRLTMPMQKLSALVAGIALDMVKGLDTTVSGVVIDVVYNGQKVEPSLNVAEACSGMRLLMTFLALGVAMAYLHYRPMWQRMLLLASTIPIAIFCNIVRVTITGFIYVLIDPAYATGIYHDMLGLATLLPAFGLYGCLAWFLGSLFIEQDVPAQKPDVIIRRRKPIENGDSAG